VLSGLNCRLTALHWSRVSSTFGFTPGGANLNLTEMFARKKKRTTARKSQHGGDGPAQTGQAENYSPKTPQLAKVGTIVLPSFSGEKFVGVTSYGESTVLRGPSAYPSRSNSPPHDRLDEPNNPAPHVQVLELAESVNLCDLREAIEHAATQAIDDLLTDRRPFAAAKDEGQPVSPEPHCGTCPCETASELLLDVGEVTVETNRCLDVPVSSSRASVEPRIDNAPPLGIPGSDVCDPELLALTQGIQLHLWKPFVSRESALRVSSSIHAERKSQLLFGSTEVQYAPHTYLLQGSLARRPRVKK
jgi:hypothetical protein